MAPPPCRTRPRLRGRVDAAPIRAPESRGATFSFPVPCPHPPRPGVQPASRPRRGRASATRTDSPSTPQRSTLQGGWEDDAECPTASPAAPTPPGRRADRSRRKLHTRHSRSAQWVTSASVPSPTPIPGKSKACRAPAEAHETEHRCATRPALPPPTTSPPYAALRTTGALSPQLAPPHPRPVPIPPPGPPLPFLSVASPPSPSRRPQPISSDTADQTRPHCQLFPAYRGDARAPGPPLPGGRPHALGLRRRLRPAPRRAAAAQPGPGPDSAERQAATRR